MKKKYNIIEVFFLCLLSGFVMVAFSWKAFQNEEKTYTIYAVHKNGTVVKVDKPFAAPIVDINDVNGIHPKYVYIQ